MKFLIDDFDDNTIEADLLDAGNAFPDDDVMYVDGVPCRLSTARNLEVEDRMSRTPNVRIDIFLVEHGYAAYFLIDGQKVESQMRDFGGSHPIYTTASHIWTMIANCLPKFAEPHEDEEDFTKAKAIVALSTARGRNNWNEWRR